MNDVAVFHPGRQHAYEVAVALQQAGRLNAFHTSVYYRPDRWPYRLVDWLPEHRRAAARRKLDYRRHPELSDDVVHSWPYAEAITQTFGRIGVVDRLSRGWFGSPFHAWASDLHLSRQLASFKASVTAIYAFEGAALRVFRQARRLGISTMLDVPSLANAGETFDLEARSLGIVLHPLPGIARRKALELSLADWKIVPSDAVAESLVSKGIPRGRILIVPFGVDTALFRPQRQSESRDFRVAFAGKFSFRKGVQYVIPAWIQAGIPGDLVIIGPPVEEEFVSAMGRKYQNSFSALGNLLPSRLACELAAADVFVFPSLAEGSALVTYEALACGLPCIVTPEAGSIVRDGIEGFIVPSRDVGAIASRLKLLYQDKELRLRMGRAARARAEQFTWADYRQRLSAAVEHVLATA